MRKSEHLVEVVAILLFVDEFVGTYPCPSKNRLIGKFSYDYPYRISTIIDFRLPAYFNEFLALKPKYRVH